jgi:hypothetical protein
MSIKEVQLIQKQKGGDSQKGNGGQAAFYGWNFKEWLIFYLYKCDLLRSSKNG